MHACMNACVVADRTHAGRKESMHDASAERTYRYTAHARHTSATSHNGASAPARVLHHVLPSIPFFPRACIQPPKYKRKKHRARAHVQPKRKKHRACAHVRPGVQSPTHESAAWPPDPMDSAAKQQCRAHGRGGTAASSFRPILNQSRRHMIQRQCSPSASSICPCACSGGSGSTRITRLCNARHRQRWNTKHYHASTTRRPEQHSACNMPRPRLHATTEPATLQSKRAGMHASSQACVSCTTDRALRIILLIPFTRDSTGQPARQPAASAAPHAALWPRAPPAAPPPRRQQARRCSHAAARPPGLGSVRAPAAARPPSRPHSCLTSAASRALPPGTTALRHSAADKEASSRREVSTRAECMCTHACSNEHACS